MAYALGVDIGGTKIAAGLVDENGNTICQTQLPSIPTDREEMFRQVVRCMEEVLNKSELDPGELTGIGLGVPGKVDCEKGIAKFQNNLPWADFPLAQRIRDHFLIQKVVIDNDVFMAAYAEWKKSGGDPNETFVYVTISTGISCCTIHKGEFIRGAGFAGEIGFLPVEENPTGKKERLEEIASGSGIERQAAEQVNLSSYYENAIRVNVKDVLADYKNQKSYAVDVVNGSLHSFSRGLYSVVCLLDPDQLILGGGIINHHPELLEPIKQFLQNNLVTNQMDFPSRLAVSQLKGDAGWVGAGLRLYEPN